MLNPTKESIIEEEYESLKSSKFKQQKLPGWRPVPSMLRVVIFFFSFGVLFIALGVVIFLFSDEIEVETLGYDDKNVVSFNVTKDMKKDIMIYYKIDGFYQNHRRYVNSRSEDQLRGKNVTLEDLEKSHECDPIVKNINLNISLPPNLNDVEVAIPCGLLAKSFLYFNDSYTFKYSNSTDNYTNLHDLYVNETNIARKKDRDIYRNSQNISQQWQDITDEHFLVWMRPAPFPNFTKLWGRINYDLVAGTKITIYINQSKYFNTTEFDNTKDIRKSLIITTANIFGGKNKEFYISYISIGGICIILGIIFIFGFKAYENKDD